MSNNEFSKQEREKYAELMSEHRLTHAEIIDQILADRREGRSMAATASSPIGAGDDIDTQIEAANRGLTLQQRIEKLKATQDKREALEGSGTSSQLSQVKTDSDDEKWIDHMLTLSGQKEKPVEVLSESDEAWISDMLRKSGQVRK
jgi:hypothetical protein